MLPTISVNYVAVIVAAIVAIVIGYLWYAVIFAEAYRREMKMTKQQSDAMMKKGMWATVVAPLLTAFVLAVIIKSVGATTVMDGIVVALWAVIGFFLPLELISMTFGNESMTTFWINVAHHVVALGAIGIILVLMP